MAEKEKVRVRFAPSPTGIPHVGNIRTALFDYFYARHNEGKFILRIEDTDQARKVEGAEDAIKESLTWLGADWDDYVIQSERLAEYKKYADDLVGKGLAREEEGAVRFSVPKNSEEISWKDAVWKKPIIYNSDDIEDFIILKKDGYPTYHLANVVDDHLMGITHVIRGEDWIPSTPKHLLLYKALGWDAPIFAHVPNVLGDDSKKLSKRHGAKTVLDFKKEGYLPEALLNSLMLLGWSPGNDQEIFSKDEVIEKFNLERINSSPAKFEEKGKLAWLNMEYIKNLSNEELVKRVGEFDDSIKEFDEEILLKMAEPARSRMKTLADYKILVEPFVGEVPATEKPELRNILKTQFGNLSEWTTGSILDVIKRVTAEQNVKIPDIYEAVIGVRQGLNIPEAFEIIGKEATLQRLK